MCPSSEDEEQRAAVVQGWMNSPGHRANILDSNGYGLRELGVGFDPNGRYWVQAFGDPYGSTSSPYCGNGFREGSEQARAALGAADGVRLTPRARSATTATR